MTIFGKSLLVLLSLAALMCACNGNSYKEPYECVNGYGFRSNFDTWEPLQLNGEDLFEYQQVTLDNDKQVDGDDIKFMAQVSCCINDFYRIGEYGKYHLLKNTLSEKGELQFLGPFYNVGMFYEDITPAIKEGEGIGYINREGKVVFWLDKVIGAKGKEAYNFMGGLSVVGTPINETGTYVYGAIDTNGNIVLPFDYFTLAYAGSGLWYAENVTKNIGIDHDDWEADIIDRNGKIIYSFPRKGYYKGTFKYPANGSKFNFAFCGNYGLIQTYWGNEWKIIDRNGKVLAENIPGISPNGKQHNNMFVFKDDESHKFGIMNQHGEIKLEAQFGGVLWLDDNVFCARKDGNYAIFDYSGNVKHDWGTTYAPDKCDKYLITERQRDISICTIDDIKKEKTIFTGYSSGISYYDERLFEPVHCYDDELWMPEIE